MLSTGRLLKCSQAFAEENEVAQKQAAAELTRRMQQLECAVQSGESRLSQWEAAHEDALQVEFILHCHSSSSRAGQMPIMLVQRLPTTVTRGSLIAHAFSIQQPTVFFGTRGLLTLLASLQTSQHNDTSL